MLKMEGLIQAFVTLFIIIGPIQSLPIFIGLTKGMPLKEIRRSFSGCMIVATVILYIFLFFGFGIFKYFGITLSSFQIAGGIIFLIIGIANVLGMEGKFFEHHDRDLSVPIATPMLTGPGTITASIILVEQYGYSVTAVSAFFALLLTWLVLMNAVTIYKLIGRHWTSIIARVMGILIAAYAIELISEGIIAKLF